MHGGTGARGPGGILGQGARAKEEKDSMEAKEDPAAKEQDNVSQHEEDERVQVAPNVGAGGSYPQATMDLAEEEGTEEEWQRNEGKEEKLKLLREPE